MVPSVTMIFSVEIKSTLKEIKYVICMIWQQFVYKRADDQTVSWFSFVVYLNGNKWLCKRQVRFLEWVIVVFTCHQLTIQSLERAALPCPALPCPALPCPCPALSCPALPHPALYSGPFRSDSVCSSLFECVSVNCDTRLTWNPGEGG